MKMTRRGLLGAASAAWATGMLGKPASAAAEFEFKLGVNTPDTHPLTIRLVEAARAIGAQSADGSTSRSSRIANSAAIQKCCRSFAPAASTCSRRPV